MSDLQKVYYLTVLWILVTEDQKLRMYDIIRLKFSSFLGNSAISNVSYHCDWQQKIGIYIIANKIHNVELSYFQHENLIWKLLIPKWAVLIFMDTFKLSHDEAIEQLEKQDKAKSNGIWFSEVIQEQI